MSLSAATWLKTYSPLLSHVRFGSRVRGKPPGVAKSIKEVLEPKIEDEELVRRMNIGFPFIRPSRSDEVHQRIDLIKKQRANTELEKLARSNQLNIDLSQTRKEWFKTSGPFHIRGIADHYGIYNDLFGKYAYFVPRVNLNINYKLSEDENCPVFYGNRIYAEQTKNAPEVSFDHKFSIAHNSPPEENTLWTLIATNPDGNLTDSNKEYVHWMISNIPNGDVSKGETIVPYLQPLPLKGTGYHRVVFVLYKQNSKVDLSEYKINNVNELDSRNFYTYDFYKKYQDVITPAGLSFFQAKYDDSVRETFHTKLDKKQPIFEYDFPEFFMKKQVHFPIRQPFNLYLDRYEDPKEVNKRYLQRRLGKTHPFDGPEPEPRFPRAHHIPKSETPTWLRTEIKKERIHKGRIVDTYE